MNKRILVVDDAKFARVVARRALVNGGYTEILEASDAAEALAVFEREKPELTLLDITLPDSSDLKPLQRMLALRPEAKIIMCSAVGQDLIVMDALEAGALDFITKPFEEPQFLSAVRAALEE